MAAVLRRAVGTIVLLIAAVSFTTGCNQSPEPDLSTDVGVKTESAAEEKIETKYPPYSEVERLHGHVCPGSAIGYRMACAGMDRIEKMGIGSRELMVIVENNRCGTDALQWVTGCTFGKGKIIFDDHGKNVYTFFSSETKRGVRVVFKGNKLPSDVMDDRDAMLKYILDAPEDDILTSKEVTVKRELPERTRGSVTCTACGEGVNVKKAQDLDGKKICIPCAKIDKGSG